MLDLHLVVNCEVFTIYLCYTYKEQEVLQFQQFLDFFLQNIYNVHSILNTCVDIESNTINDKKCSLSIALTAMDQKLQKS